MAAAHSEAPQMASYPLVYRQAAGGAVSPTASAPTAMTEAEFERIARRKYGIRTIRTGTEAEQTAAVASRIRPTAPAITLPHWQSWNPGTSSQVYDLILESFEGFPSSIGGVPAIQTIVFFNTEYEPNLSPAGVPTLGPQSQRKGVFRGG